MPSKSCPPGPDPCAHSPCCGSRARPCRRRSAACASASAWKTCAGTTCGTRYQPAGREAGRRCHGQVAAAGGARRFHRGHPGRRKPRALKGRDPSAGPALNEGELPQVVAHAEPARVDVVPLQLRSHWAEKDDHPAAKKCRIESYWIDWRVSRALDTAVQHHSAERNGRSS